MINTFTDTDYNIENSVYYDLYNYYKEGGKYSKDAPYHEYSCTWDNGTSATFIRMDDMLLMNGYKQVMGWMLDFRDIWNKYLVNIKYYGWIEYYAPSKMAIRDAVGNNNIIDKIVEL